MEQKIIHIDLFSGIGGFALAVDYVFGKENTTHIFSEIDPFCQAVLRKHWPGAEIHGDIRTFTNAQRKGLERSKSNKELQPVRHLRQDSIYLLTGGFPCQPFSQAGRRKGTKDNRFLWPEMARVIKEFRPTWVIAENVRGLLTIEQGVVFEQVCLDLEGLGYEVGAFIIPAVAVNAPHRRDRVWIVANRTSEGLERGKQPKATRSKSEQCADASSDAQNPISERSRGGMESERQVLERQSSEIENARSSWKENWLEVTTRLCRVDDGLPRQMDGVTISAARHRKERLKACGNAIVPQVAMIILLGIKECSR